MLAQLQREKDTMNTTLKEAVLNNRTDINSLRRLADLYAIDLNEIQQKSSVRRSHSLRRAKKQARLERKAVRPSARSHPQTPAAARS
jgi:hypothetical protein